MAQEDSRQEGRRAERWARVNFPNKFVHPHEYTARDGRVFDKMFVSIPPGVTLNGVDLGGYAFDHFAKPREIEQKPMAVRSRSTSVPESRCACSGASARSGARWRSRTRGICAVR